MSTRLFHVPFAMGQDESISPIELPSGPLREATNVRQRRFHSFGVRPDYPAVGMTEFLGLTMVPYDLFDLNGEPFTFDKSTGRNGDIIQLTIRSNRQSQLGASAFLLTSKLGNTTHTTFGLVGQ